MNYESIRYFCAVCGCGDFFLHFDFVDKQPYRIQVICKVCETEVVDSIAYAERQQDN